MRSGFAAWVMVIGLAGCSGGGGSQECQSRVDQFEACGGDLVADWTIQGACIGQIQPSHILFSACPSATLTAEMETAGELLIGDDHFEPVFTRQQFRMHVEIPITCLSPLALTCAYVEDELNADPTTTATCSEDGDLCICDADQDLIDEWTGEMPYSHLPNHQILLTSPDGTEYRIPYCAERHEATLEIDFRTSQGSAMVYFTGTR